MNISDEAVEASAKALWDLDRESTAKAYEDCRDGSKRHLRREARAVLEAAAPHMFAPLLELADEIEQSDSSVRAYVISHRLRQLLGAGHA